MKGCFPLSYFVVSYKRKYVHQVLHWLTTWSGLLQFDIFYCSFSTPAIFFEEMELMFVIHNILIATGDDIIQFGDDVNIYPV